MLLSVWAICGRLVARIEASSVGDGGNELGAAPPVPGNPHATDDDANATRAHDETPGP
jgi:hypothetical protein